MPYGLCYHRFTGAACSRSSDDKIAFVEYTMAGDETSGMVPVDEQIDVCGLQCPLPVLKAQKRLKSLKNGQLLRVLATDPMAEIDFPHYCNESGNELISSTRENDMLVFVIRKSHAK
jgi:tRNA 2-thiouridine synthesizing protein A